MLTAAFWNGESEEEEAEKTLDEYTKKDIFNPTLRAMLATKPGMSMYPRQKNFAQLTADMDQGVHAGAAARAPAAAGAGWLRSKSRRSSRRRAVAALAGESVVVEQVHAAAGYLCEGRCCSSGSGGSGGGAGRAPVRRLRKKAR